MPRIRTIKPEFWSHPLMGRIDDASKTLALALLNLADDEGYFLADPILVRNFARPFDEDSTITRRSLDTLSKAEWISIWEHPTHGPIGKIENFNKHQKIDRSTPSKLKVYFDSSTTRRVFDEDSLQEGKGMEGKNSCLDGIHTQGNHLNKCADGAAPHGDGNPKHSHTAHLGKVAS